MITIHHAKTDEVYQIKALLSRTWVDSYREFLPEEIIRLATSTWHSPENLHREIVNPNVYFGLAKNDAREIVGLATAVMHSETTIYLTRLYVDPQAQRQGIGSRLLQAVIQHYPQASTMRLEVERNNVKGSSFYRKQGFTEISRKEIMIADTPITVIEMQWSISRQKAPPDQ